MVKHTKSKATKRHDKLGKHFFNFTSQKKDNIPNRQTVSKIGEKEQTPNKKLGKEQGSENSP